MSLLLVHLLFIIFGIVLLQIFKDYNFLSIIYLLTSMLSFIFAIYIFYNIEILIGTRINLLEIIPNLSINFSIDYLGSIFLLISNGLWFMTSIYSIQYLKLNKFSNEIKFYTFFMLSMFATNAIIYSSNLLTTFIFYELLTIATYPLVTYKGNEESIINGKKYLYYLLGTSIVFLLPAIILTYSQTGTLDYTQGGIFTDQSSLMINILLLMFVIGTAKIAIMPFHKWLPAAMVAPTPVSALLHAVAVVKSGVFIIVKIILYIFGPAVLLNTGAIDILIALTSVTIIASSIIAINQDNIKLRLAYSTIGQLSYIILATIILAPYSLLAAILHFIFHAIGKIILFLTSGILMTQLNIKNVSEMDGIARKLPYTIFLMSLGSLIMVGLPPTVGFISKWFLIKGLIESHSIYLLLVILLSTLLNAAYYFPIIFRPYFNTSKTKDVKEIAEDPLLIGPIIIIGILAIYLFFVSDSIIMFIQKTIIII